MARPRIEAENRLHGPLVIAPFRRLDGEAYILGVAAGDAGPCLSRKRVD
jgi:hypothetical protein